MAGARGSARRTPKGGEGDVLGALEAPDRVGDRLPVAREQEPPHRAAPTAAAAALRRARVSAFPRMLTTSKIGGLAVLPVSAMRVSWARSTSLSPRSAARKR